MNAKLDYRGMMAPGYQHDISTLYRYTGDVHKLTFNKTKRTTGIEIPKDERTEKGTKNDTKLKNNMDRAKSTINELAICNTWEWFVNLTIDEKKMDRYELKGYIAKLTDYVRNIKKKKGTEIQYLWIPEKHEDGAWHIHGLMNGIKDVRRFEITEHLPYKILERIKQGKEVYEWVGYRERFGFCDIGSIENKEAVSKYVTKYITKDLSRTIQDINAHLYYSSQGLKRREKLVEGQYTGDIRPDYMGEYAGSKWINARDTDIEYVKSQFIRNIDDWVEYDMRLEM